MAFVYITTNLINGKKYLGKHNGTKPNYLGSGKLLKHAIEKYGKKYFKLEKISGDISDKDAYDLERKLSLEWNIVEDDQWYNLSVGGDGFCSGELHPCYGIPRSDECRKKLAEANLGKKQPYEQRKKQSVAMSGNNNPYYGVKGDKHPAFGHKKSDTCKKSIADKKRGIPRSQETKDKISAARKGRNLAKNRVYREDGSYYYNNDGL